MGDTSSHFFAKLLAVFALFWPGASARAETHSWNGLIVSSIESQSFNKSELARIGRTLGIAEGRELDLKRLDDGVRELFQNGRVQTLFIDGLLEGKTVRLVVRGSRARKLRHLDFRNLDPDVLSEVRRRTGLEEGQLMDVRSFNGVRDRLKSAYEARGYYYANVQIVVNDVDDSNEADVEISVQPNAPTRVSKVSVSGGSKEENEKMHEQISLRKGDRFEKQMLDHSVDSINRYLRNNQYPTSKVEEASLNFSEDMLEVEVDVSVKMGARFQYQFLKNRVFDDSELRDLLTDEIITQADATNRIIEKVENKYREVGYHFCKVTPLNIEGGRDQATIVQLIIDEGSKVLVDELAVSGDEGMDSSALQDLFFESAPGVLHRGVYWEKGLKEAAATMQNRLHAMGFLSARINDPKSIFTPDQKGVRLYLDADLGPRTYVSSVEYSGLNHFTADELSKDLTFRDGDPLDKEKVFAARKAILARYSDDGFIDAKFIDDDEASIELTRDQKRATVKLRVVEGTRYRVGTVRLEGNSRTKSEVIYREMKLKTGEYFSPKKLRASEEAVGSLGLFARVEVTATNDPADAAVKDLSILVRETRPGVGEVGLGGRYEYPRFRVRGFTGFAYRNLNGLNQTASARTELALPFSGIGSSLIPFVEYSVTLGYRAPNPYNLPMIYGATAGLERFEVNPRPSTILGRARIDNRLERRFSNWFMAAYKLHHYEYTVTEEQQAPAGSPPGTLPDPDSPRIPTNQALIGSTGPTLTFDFRDDIFNPSRGTYHSLDVELAHPYLLSQPDIGFVMVLSKNSLYLPIPQPFAFSLYAGFAYAHSFFDSAIPTPRLVNELALGGQASIRGFNPKSVTAPTSTTLNLASYNFRSELKVNLFSGLGFAVFYDTGQMFPNFQTTARYDGVGVGFRYKTPVGPVVIDFAQSLGPIKDTLKFYFTVGTI